MLENLRKELGPAVTLLDNDVIVSIHSAQLPKSIHLLPPAAKAIFFPHLQSASLISLPQLCNNGCQYLLTAEGLHTIKDGSFIVNPTHRGTQVLYGKRNQRDRLWNITIPQQPEQIVSPLTAYSVLLRTKKATSSSKISSPTSIQQNVFHIEKVPMALLNSTSNLYKKQDSFTSNLPLVSKGQPSSTNQQSSLPNQLNVIVRKKAIKKGFGQVFSASFV